MMHSSSPTSAVVFCLLAFLVLPAGGCDGDPTSPGDPVPLELRAPGLDTDGWTLVERPDFTVRLPPGFEMLDVQPIDSDAGRYRKGQASTLSYDFGVYSAPIEIPGAANEVHRDVRTEIGGRPAVLLAFRHDGEWVVEARWPDLDEALGSSVALLITGRTPRAEVRDEILETIHSVRFR